MEFSYSITHYTRTRNTWISTYAMTSSSSRSNMATTPVSSKNRWKRLDPGMWCVSDHRKMCTDPMSWEMKWSRKRWRKSREKNNRNSTLNFVIWAMRATPINTTLIWSRQESIARLKSWLMLIMTRVQIFGLLLVWCLNSLRVTTCSIPRKEKHSRKMMTTWLWSQNWSVKWIRGKQSTTKKTLNCGISTSSRQTQRRQNSNSRESSLLSLGL